MYKLAKFLVTILSSIDEYFRKWNIGTSPKLIYDKLGCRSIVHICVNSLFLDADTFESFSKNELRQS